MDAGETTAGRLEERNYEDFLRGETVIEACSLPWQQGLMKSLLKYAGIHRICRPIQLSLHILKPVKSYSGSNTAR